MRSLLAWLNIGLVLGPVVVLVLRQCRAADLRPTFPVAGLVIGLLLELSRK